MAMGLTGVSAATAASRLLGEGMLYMNYGEVGERLLGATQQGQWDPGIELGQDEIAGTLGVLVGTDRIQSCKPTIQATLIEVTTENLVAMLPGGADVAMTTRARAEGEWLGLGDGIVVAFNLDEDNIYADTLRIWEDVGFGPVLLTETTDYTVVAATGVVTFVAAPPAAVEATSVSGLAPSIDMTGDLLEVDMVIQLDGGAPTPVVFAWAGMNTGVLIAGEIQAKIQALGGLFAAVTCTYTPAVPGVSDYYTITGSTTGAAMSVVITSGGLNSCTEELKLGVAEGGTENFGGDAANLTANYHYDPQDGVQTHDRITVDGIVAADYLLNVAWLGRCADQTAEELIITILNPLPIEMAAWTLEGKGAIGVQVTFRGSVSGTAPQTLPFTIDRPLPA